MGVKKRKTKHSRSSSQNSLNRLWDSNQQSSGQKVSSQSLKQLPAHCAVCRFIIPPLWAGCLKSMGRDCTCSCCYNGGHDFMAVCFSTQGPDEVQVCFLYTKKKYVQQWNTFFFFTVNAWPRMKIPHLCALAIQFLTFSFIPCFPHRHTHSLHHTQRYTDAHICTSTYGFIWCCWIIERLQ